MQSYHWLSSTKIKTRGEDLEILLSEKGNQWHFGIKAHMARSHKNSFRFQAQLRISQAASFG